MQYINEENLGPEATEQQARELVKILQGQGWEVRYGDSLSSNALTDAEQTEFDRAFYGALDKVS